LGREPRARRCVELFMSSRRRGSSIVALAASVALHAAVLFVLGAVRPVGHAYASAFEGSTSPDAWIGDTLDVELAVEARSGEPRKSARSPGAERVTDVPEPSRGSAAPPTVEPQVTDTKRRSTEAATPEVTRKIPTAPEPESSRVPSDRALPPAGTAEAPEHLAVGAEQVSEPEARRRAAGPASSAAASTGLAFGAAGLAPGTRDLAQAFTRALPATVRTMTGPWRSLPVGTTAEARVAFRIGEDGKITDYELREPKPQRFVRDLLRRARLLLEGGQFALRPDWTGPGSQTFDVKVELTRREPADDPILEPTDIMHRGYERPTGDRPGRAFFTAASGRHVELIVRIVPESRSSDAAEDPAGST